MANPSRDKGTRGETLVVGYLRTWYPNADRHALHGSRDVGDINGVPGLVISVKAPGAGKPINLSGWLHDLDVMVANAREVSSTGVVVVRRTGYPDPGRWYAVQEFGRWLERRQQPPTV